ncbi:c-type cytochrome [Arenicella xantha]|uniref:c-type cytochrome n=1 Tax=Arenicella xantha TaxID=644221 RepID=UPI001B885061|nr:c-type cytochrome [Arenicella xantha]
MKSTHLKLGLLLSCMMLAACSQEKVANRGFSLPSGDIENGRMVFLEYQCLQCHVLQGTEFSDDEWRLTEGDGIAVELGGATTKLQTYGDLVTSIINPSHRIAKGYPVDQVTENGESKMAYYNQVMTVEELIDLVTFLRSKYEFKSYPETIYPYYVYPG